MVPVIIQFSHILCAWNLHSPRECTLFFIKLQPDVITTFPPSTTSPPPPSLSHTIYNRITIKMPHIIMQALNQYKYSLLLYSSGEMVVVMLAHLHCMIYQGHFKIESSACEGSILMPNKTYLLCVNAVFVCYYFSAFFFSFACDIGLAATQFSTISSHHITAKWMAYGQK